MKGVMVYPTTEIVTLQGGKVRLWRIAGTRSFLAVRGVMAADAELEELIPRLGESTLSPVDQVALEQAGRRVLEQETVQQAFSRRMV